MVVMVGKKKTKTNNSQYSPHRMAIADGSSGTSCSQVLMMEPAQLQDYLVDGPFLEAI
jgi:hypothetical protein